MSKKRMLIYILGILLFMMPFQNCGVMSPLNQGLSLSSIEKSAHDTGNGGGYEGKPDGTYYYFIPNYSCGGTPAAEQISEIKNGQALLYNNNGDQCANQSTPISMNDVNASPFEKDFISIKDALFKRYDEKPVGIPDTIAEVLCRDNFENPTFEIVTHNDRETNEALARVYFQGKQISDFAVSRVLSSNEVRYVADNLSFKVDLSKPVAVERKFAGQVVATTLAGVQAQSLVCVIGGSIDTSKWSLKALTDVDAGPFQLMGNDEILFFSEVSRHYFSSTLFSTVTHLFKIGLDQVVSDFSKIVFGDNYDITSTSGRVGGSLYLFFGKLTSEKWTSMFVYDVRTGKVKRLTNLNADAEPEAYLMQQPVLTSDEHFFYDTLILHNDMSRTTAVRVYNLKDDSITDIAMLDESKYNGYMALPKTNKLLISWLNKNNVSNVIEIYDAKSKTSKDLPLQIAGNCHVMGYSFQNMSDESSILATQTCDGSKSDVVQISLSTGQVKTIASDSHVSWSSDDLNRFILTTTTKENIAYDIRTGQTINLPMDPGFGFDLGVAGSTNFSSSLDSAKVALVGDRFLYGFGGNTDAPSMYQVDLTSGASTQVCPAVLGKKMFVGMLPNQKVFLFTYDSQLKVYRFYQVKSLADCPRINEFPSEFPYVPQLMPTSIGFGLLLGKALTLDSTNIAAEAVFVPMDGRPPLKFNPNVKGNWQMDVSTNQNRIILRGPDNDNVVRIFSFDL